MIWLVLLVVVLVLFPGVRRRFFAGMKGHLRNAGTNWGK